MVRRCDELFVRPRCHASAGRSSVKLPHGQTIGFPVSEVSYHNAVRFEAGIWWLDSVHSCHWDVSEAFATPSLKIIVSSGEIQTVPDGEGMTWYPFTP